jgi:hypothetical protein
MLTAWRGPTDQTSCVRTNVTRKRKARETAANEKVLFTQSAAAAAAYSVVAWFGACTAALAAAS